MRKFSLIAALFIFIQSSSAIATVAIICPDGSYIYGSTCAMTPEGTYQGVTDIAITPDGTTYSKAPDGQYVRSPNVTMTPDGSYPYAPNLQMYPGGIEGSYTAATWFGTPPPGGAEYTFAPDGSYVGCGGSC